MLTALQETETALSNYANELDRRAALTEARDQAARAADLSRLRFNAGADSFLLVLDAERTQAAADAALAQSDALVTTYQIALFRALAGVGRPTADRVAILKQGGRATYRPALFRSSTVWRLSGCSAFVPFML